MATKFQLGTVRTIHRREIQDAPYNPRRIRSGALERLKRNIKDVGLLGPAIVVNETTMHVLSGHQRLHVLDALEGSDDYSLSVTLVKLSAKKEREQNVFMNARGAQGDFDLEKLHVMLDADFSALDAGFSMLELDALFAGTEFEREVPDVVPAEVDAALVRANEAKADAKDMKKRRKEMREENAAHNAEFLNPDFYAIVVFRSAEQATRFLRECGGGVEGEHAVDGIELAQRLGIELPE